ncbi:hypothetical protein HDU76_004871 [Blyttiomyces sp. JEL0837]|nr:hypothetical protein HDU76_004871 [Blyttiomyces sp. JEL0837]
MLTGMVSIDPTHTVYCAKVQHISSSSEDGTIFLDVRSPVTLAAFKGDIATELSLLPTSISIFHVNPSGPRIKVTGDRSLLMLLTAADKKSEAASFVCEGTPIGKGSTTLSNSATSSTFVLKVIYEGTDYAIEIKSPSLEEFGQELCKQFAWNKDDLESMQIVHNTTVVTSSTYFERILTTHQQSDSSTVADVEFLLRPKELPSRPRIVSLDSLGTSALVQVSPLVEGVANAGYDVMLSYEWTTGKTLVQIIKKELQSRGMRVWFDEEQMHANMYERMAEAIANSSVVTPILTVAYSKSANCKRELSYAGDLKKDIKPARALNKNEKLERWVELITAGTIYYDFSEALNDQRKLEHSITALCNSIEKQLAVAKKVGDESHVGGEDAGIGKSPLEEWLVPVDFGNDAERFQRDYVAGTRIWAIDGVHEWLLSEETGRLLWLNGGAGLGKSIIAHLVSTNLPPTFTLGSIFYCKHDDASKNKAEKIISTMAFNLATKLPAFNTFLNDAMVTDKLRVSKGENPILSSPSSAFKDLIIKGLNSIPKPDQNFLIIVDALDEIGKQGDQTRNDFLNVLRFDVDKLPSWVRLFVTSRPEMDIYRVLNGVNSSVLVPEDSHNLEDIDIFVRFQLSSRLGTEEVLTDDQINTVASRLAHNTGGVFHYARLACNHMTDRAYVSYGEALEVASNFSGGLDQIYTQVLAKAFSGERVESGLNQRYRKVMGCIITAREPVDQVSIAKLVGLTVGEVGGIVLRIQPILNISNGPIKVLHKSLKDFLSSPERCRNPHFFIDTTIFETILAAASLTILGDGLSYNMAKLKNDNEPIPHNAAKCIDSTLSYASRYWVSHTLASSDRQLLIPNLGLFIKTSILYWIESTVLLNAFSLELGHQCKHVADWVKSSGIDSESAATAMEFLEDTARFIWRFRASIHRNPLQIYTVGVVFSPPQSKIHQTFSNIYVNPKIVMFKRVIDWGPHLYLFLGHRDTVHQVCYSPDGSKIASASKDGMVRIWDVGSAKELRRIDGHVDSVSSVCFSGDSKLLVSGSLDMNVILWEVESGIELRRFKGHTDGVNCVCFSPDGSIIASAGYDCVIRIWDCEIGIEVMQIKGHLKGVQSVEFSKDGKFIASAGDDKIVRIWDVTTGNEVITLIGHGKVVNSASFSPDGNLLVSGSGDATVRVWDVKTGKTIHTLAVPPNRVETTCFSPDGTLILSGLWDSSIRLWNVETGQQLQKLEGHAHGVLSACFSPDGKQIVSASFDHSIAMWTCNVASNRTVKTTRLRFHTVLSGVFPREGNFVGTGFADKCIHVWNAKTNMEIRTLEGHTGPVSAICLSPDGKTIASGSRDHTVRIWDLEKGIELTKLEVHSKIINSVCFSHNGNIIASGADDNTLVLCDIKTGLELQRFSGFKDGIKSISFSNDNLHVAVGSLDRTIKVFDVKDGNVILNVEGHREAVFSVCFTPHGSKLVSGGLDGLIKVWDVASGKELKVLAGHTDRVWNVLVSKNGEQIVSLSSDNTVRTWDIESGLEIVRMKGAVFDYLATFGRMRQVELVDGLGLFVTVWVGADEVVTLTP